MENMRWTAVGWKWIVKLGRELDFAKYKLTKKSLRCLGNNHMYAVCTKCFKTNKILQPTLPFWREPIRDAFKTWLAERWAVPLSSSVSCGCEKPAGWWIRSLEGAPANQWPERSLWYGNSHGPWNLEGACSTYCPYVEKVQMSIDPNCIHLIVKKMIIIMQLAKMFTPLTAYKDGQHESSTKVKSTHLDLIGGCIIGHKLLPLIDIGLGTSQVKNSKKKWKYIFSKDGVCHLRSF